jgi:hypothetical protein
MDMPTLAALLGHSKLNMVMRYAHPQEQHQADAMRRLEAFNAAKEIAEVERTESTEWGYFRKSPHKFPHRSPKSRRFFKGRNRR